MQLLLQLLIQLKSATQFSFWKITDSSDQPGYMKSIPSTVHFMTSSQRSRIPSENLAPIGRDAGSEKYTPDFGNLA